MSLITCFKNMIRTTGIILISKRKHTQIRFSATVLNTYFEGDNYVGERTFLHDCTLGKFSYISKDCELMGVRIGRFTSIAPRCYILIGNHPTKKIVSTHPALYSCKRPAGRCLVSRNKFDEFRYVDKDKKITVDIGNDVWIASDVKILGGVKIADGTVVAAGAVVTKNTEPYSIVGGIPAKTMGYRFEKAKIDQLEKLKWWDKNEDWLREHADYFDDVDLFLQHL